MAQIGKTRLLKIHRHREDHVNFEVNVCHIYMEA